MRVLALILLFSAAALAQFGEGVAVSVTRSITLAADEAAFTVVVSTSLDTTGEQVLQALQTAGLQNLTMAGTAFGQAYSYPETGEVRGYYQVNFTVPAANAKDAAKKLEALRITPPELFKSVQYVAALGASTASLESTRQTVLPQLLAEAQKKAQSLAAASGIKLGAIKSVTENFNGVYGLVTNWISSPQMIGSSFSNTASGGTQYTYYLSATYALAP